MSKNGKSGFSLIELMVVLVIMGGILMLASREYLHHIEYVKKNRAAVDLDDLAKIVRLYQLREENVFPVATFTATDLGPLIGSYFEKDPPRDPWGRPYKFNSEVGALYSTGKDGIDGFAALSPASSSDDDILNLIIPKEFHVTKAEYVDANQNNSFDFGDYIELTFSRPAQMTGVSSFDFVTKRPDKALGSSRVGAPRTGKSLKIYFFPPVLPTVVPGETTLRPRDFIESIKDFSQPPQTLDPKVEVVIKRKRL